MLQKVIKFIPPIIAILIVQARFGTDDYRWLTTLSTFFVAILLEAMPFVLLGAILSGAIEVLVPRDRIARMVPKNPFQAVLLFGLMGIAFPMCECGIVPVIRRLLNKGVPLSCGITYLLAAPIVQPIVLIATFVAFNGSWKIAALRILGGYLTAVAVGTMAVYALDPQAQQHILSKTAGTGHDHSDHICSDDLHDHHDHDHDCNHDHGNGHQHEHDDGAVARPILVGAAHAEPALSAAAAYEGALPITGRVGLGSGAIELPVLPAKAEPAKTAAPSILAKIDFVLKHSADDFLTTGYYLIFGALVAAAMQTFIGESVLAAVGTHGPVAGALVMMALAFVMSLCSTADAFVAAAFTQFSISARMAFLVMGPMVDIKLVAMYNGFLSRKATVFIFGSAAACAFAFAMACHCLGVDKWR